MAAVKTLTVNIVANAANFEKGLAKARKSLNKIERDVKQVANGIKAVAAPVVAFGGFAVKAFADFDSAMKNSMSIMGDLSSDMKRDLKDAAMDISESTKFSSKEAAEAFYFLASAGLDAKQSIAALPAVAAYAQAGNFNLARATDILTDAQTALGLASEDPVENLQNMTRVSDVLVGAATRANMSVEQFGEALTRSVAVTLRAANKEIEEGVAVLEAFAQQGKKGSEAATLFTRTFQSLQKQAVENRKAFEAWNIEIFDSQGNLKNYADMIASIERALKGKSAEEQTAILSSLRLNETAQQGVRTLLGMSESIRESEQALKGMGGITKEVAARQRDFWQEVNEARAAVTNLAIEIGSHLAKSLIPYLTWVKESAQEMRGLGESVHKQIAGWIGFTARVLAATVALQGLIKGFKLLLPLLGPKGLLAAALIGTLSTFEQGWVVNFSIGLKRIEHEFKKFALELRLYWARFVDWMIEVSNRLWGMIGRGFSLSLGYTVGGLRKMWGDAAQETEEHLSKVGANTSRMAEKVKGEFAKLDRELKLFVVGTRLAAEAQAEFREKSLGAGDAAKDQAGDVDLLSGSANALAGAIDDLNGRTREEIEETLAAAAAIKTKDRARSDSIRKTKEQIEVEKKLAEEKRKVSSQIQEQRKEYSETADILTKNITPAFGQYADGITGLVQSLGGHEGGLGENMMAIGARIKEFFTGVKEEIRDADGNVVEFTDSLSTLGMVASGLDFALMLADMAGLSDFELDMSGISDGFAKSWLRDWEVKKKEQFSQTEAIFSAIGTAIGAYFGGAGGAMVGASVGTGIGKIWNKVFGGWKHVSRLLRRAFNDFMNDLLAGKGIQIRMFDGTLQQFDRFVFQSKETWNTAGWAESFHELAGDAWSAFHAVGLALGHMAGVGAEVAGQVGYALAVQLGGDIENLGRLLRGLEIPILDMEEMLLAAFKRGEISLREYIILLNGLREGYAESERAQTDFNLAVERFVESSGDGMDSIVAFRDLVAAAMHEGVTRIDEFLDRMVQTGMITREQAQMMGQALQNYGITSIEQLVGASEDILGGIIVSITSMTEETGQLFFKIMQQGIKTFNGIGDAAERNSNRIQNSQWQVNPGTTANANGNAYAGGRKIEAYARGGVVSQPTIAPMALFGEAGPEAIMPLKRLASGKLGVVAELPSNFEQAVNITIDARGAELGFERRIKRELENYFERRNREPGRRI